MLNQNWLNTFVTLVDTGHFTKTAEKLFMTQPGVSQHINKLEKACGHSLIQRENKSFEVTEQGHLVYQYAQKLIKNEYELLEKLDFDNPFSGVCKLACSGALAMTLYPKLLNIQVQHKNLVVEIKAAPNEQILHGIKDGIIDLGIVTEPPNNNAFDVSEIGQEQLCLVVPADTKSDEFDENLLTKLGLINHPDAKHYLSIYVAQHSDSHINQLNIEQLAVTGYVNQISQILEPVAKGLGFTVLPKNAVESFKERQQLKILKPEKPVIEVLYQVKKRNRLLPARFATINTVLQNHFNGRIKITH